MRKVRTHQTGRCAVCYMFESENRTLTSFFPKHFLGLICDELKQLQGKQKLLFPKIETSKKKQTQNLSCQIRARPREESVQKPVLAAKTWKHSGNENYFVSCSATWQQVTQKGKSRSIRAKSLCSCGVPSDFPLTP